MATDPKIDPLMFVQMFATALDPELNMCLGAIRQVADYDIHKDQAASFLRFHEFITSPQPPYITRWREDKKREQKWYHPHVNGILGDVRGAMAAAHYHVDRLTEIESNVNRILDSCRAKDRLGRATMGIGGTRKMDIEYQAFVLAFRRCLDYLSGALACYFMTELNSFRSFPDTIAKMKKSPNVATALVQAHTRHVDQLGFVLADGRRSVRNRVAHYEFVSAGCVNLTAQGFFLAGGGEELSLPEELRGARLGEVLSERIMQLHSCVDDMIDTFVGAAREDQSYS